MPIVSQGNSVVLDVGAHDGLWIKSTGSAEVTVNQVYAGTPEVINVTTETVRVGFYGEPVTVSIRAVSGQAEYQDQQFSIQPITPDSSPLDVSLAVNGLNERTENISDFVFKSQEKINQELTALGFKGYTNSILNSGSFYTLFAGAGVSSSDFIAPFGWTYATATANKRWISSGPLTWDMSSRSVILAFKIKAAAQSSSQTYGGSMSGSSAGFSIVVRASTDATYPNAIEIRCRSGGGNFDSYFITQNLMDDTFHSVVVGFCAVRKIMYVWVDGIYNGQQYMTRVMEWQSRGNLVGNERFVLGAGAASGTNSWIHSGKSLFYWTYDGAISDLNMNQAAFNHMAYDSLEGL